ncbi:glycosyltransferase [bacterium]|nr:glycosyltransferase [bacterium]MBT3853651.1 glycosyltransferase [bacterium]MBT4633366.1 glycosyltransferase [bacterium]MBT5491907.1 glycosyltransferase [bacterium]MBT6778435.1 glycosyltransferase [bacterium]
MPYKKFDLIVEAFNKNGRKLILVTNTDNKLYRELREKSKDNIEWKFNISNEEKNELFSQAKAFLFPPEEDFGLVPIEAMAC